MTPEIAHVLVLLRSARRSVDRELGRLEGEDYTTALEARGAIDAAVERLRELRHFSVRVEGST